MDIIELLKCRRADLRLGRISSDGEKLGLVVEGGGMRGVVSGAMIAALEKLGFSDCFDAVYGASAGAMAAAYFVAGNASAGATIYYEEINNRRFINVFRPLIGKPILDLGYLVDSVFAKSTPLNYSAISSSKVKLGIVTTNAISGERTVFDNRTGPLTIRDALRASATNPVIAGSPVRIGDGLYWDAILSESIPAKTAIDDGCTSIIVLRTRPLGKTRSKVGFIEKLLAKVIIKPVSRTAYAAYCAKSESYLSELDFLAKLDERCAVIYPTSEGDITQTCTDRKKLIRAAKDGYRAVLESINVPDQVVAPMIGHYPKRS